MLMEGKIDRKPNIKVQNYIEISVWKVLLSVWIHYTFQHINKDVVFVMRII